MVAEIKKYILFILFKLQTLLSIFVILNIVL